ncbi:MAG TPA: hypothetical protein PKB10_06965 [Tepidisphaeraceae bacterium]|nr:hypothetical protein [Tepidisphaeraceae bacterium]
MTDPDFDPIEERRVFLRSLPWLILTLLGGGLLMAGFRIRGQAISGVLMLVGIAISIVGLAMLLWINSRPPTAR